LRWAKKILVLQDPVETADPSEARNN